MAEDSDSARAKPAYWDGTLLKCPGCRLKFPFSAAQHDFRSAGAASARRGTSPAPITTCPQCNQPVRIT